MPHSKRVSPEGSGDSDRNSQRNGTEQNHGEEPGPAPNSLRRDENSISFRHFLQPQSDVVPVRHRPCRGASAGSVDLVDGAAMALPDFVQDHLAADGGVVTSDQQSNGPTQQDVHHLGGGIPDYANLSSSSYEYSSQRGQHYMNARNGRPDGNPVSNGDSAAHGGPAQIALPDFLSDGPMLCNSNNALESLSHLQSASASPLRNPSSSNSTTPSSTQGTSRNERESLMRQIEQLTRELEEKNRSIYRLERDLRKQQNETSMLETAYLNAKHSLQAVTRRAASAESRVADLVLKLRKSPEHASRPPSDGRSSDEFQKLNSHTAHSSTAASSNGVSQTINPHEVMDIALSTEFLVGELLEQVQSLKRLAMSTTEEPEAIPFKGLKKEKNKPKPDGNSK